MTLSRGSPPITHLCFADHLFIFVEASTAQVDVIRECPDIFESSSGQKISQDKSKIFFSKNVNHTSSIKIAQAFGFLLTNDLGKYLGVPINHRRVTSSYFSHVTEKLMHNLSNWKAHTLSLVGRITLCSSILSSIPSYIMQTSLLLGNVCNDIDKVCRKFVWGCMDGRRKIHLCDWDTLCKPKLVGGLGIRQAHLANLAHMTKIGWSLIHHQEELWVRVLRSSMGVAQI